MALTIGTAPKNAGLNATYDLLNSGTIGIYSGTRPATAGTALSGNTLLATLTLGATAFAAASGGTKTANAITSGTAGNTGTATFFRAFESDGTTVVCDGTVGTSATDMIIATTSIVAAATVSCSSWVITAGG
jgi:hypothetical protein